MKKLMIALPAVFLFVFLFAAVVTPQPGPDGDRPMRKQIHDRLNLTEEQDTKIEALRSEHMKHMVDLRADLKKAEIDAGAVRKNDNISRAEAVAAVEKINKIKNEIALAAVNHRMDVYEILTPEQRKIWQEERGEFAGRFKEKFKDGKGLRGEKLKKRIHWDD